MGTTNDHFGVSKEGLLASIWTMTIVASILTIARCLTRHFLLRGLDWDDAFQFASWLFLLGSDVAYTYYIPANFKLSAIATGSEPKPSDAEFYVLEHQIFTAELVLPFLFWTCLFCAKFSFLWLYGQILRGSGVSKKVWWIASVGLLCIYGIILIGVFGECGSARNLTHPEACSSPSSVSLANRLIRMGFALNVFSDLLVMILPLPLLWRLQMPSRQKLAITAVFSLAWVTIAMDILRLVETERSLPEVTWLYTSLETEVAVIVASLPAFSFLVSDSPSSKETRDNLREAFSLHSGSSRTAFRLGLNSRRSDQTNITQNERVQEASFDLEETQSKLSSVTPVKAHGAF